METADFFRARIDAMINLSDPLAVLASRLPWDLIETSLAATFERRDRAGQVLEGQDSGDRCRVAPDIGGICAGNEFCMADYLWT